MKNDNRVVLELIKDSEDTSPKAMQDREILKAFGLILERANAGTIDAEDVAFVTARRDYLSDEQLMKMVGKTHAELEAGIEESADESLSSMSKDELTAKAEDMGLEVKGNEKKAELIKMIEEATA